MNRNAYIGMNVETLFMNSLPDHPSVIKKIQEHFNIKGHFQSITRTGIHHEKADVIIGFTCGRNINANIKAYKAGFNHLTRCSINIFATHLELSDANRQLLEEAVIRKARKKTVPLFSLEEQTAIGEHFIRNKKKILLWGFSDNPSREILVLYDRNESIMTIYPMKEVLNKIEKQPLIFTRGGFNIGDYVSFQRKGGNGVHSKKIAKDDIKHPGNNVQLKLRPRRFVADTDMARLQIATYKI